MCFHSHSHSDSDWDFSRVQDLRVKFEGSNLLLLLQHMDIRQGTRQLVLIQTTSDTTNQAVAINSLCLSLSPCT